MYGDNTVNARSQRRQQSARATVAARALVFPAAFSLASRILATVPRLNVRFHYALPLRAGEWGPYSEERHARDSAHE